ncbi:hypothetical protein N7470_001795 [Penicillium chermesinum]|nr:hypothetical protein N7470_001795 [Penicillium chermesinum]
MSEPPKKTIKLKFGKRPTEPPPEPEPAPASSETPSRKITLKIGKKPKDQAEATPASEEKSKKKKQPTKKRPAETVAQPETPATQQAPKRLKLTSKKPGVQSIRIKNKGVVQHRPVGVGYDSEASDCEADPSIEEQFILRMLPGEDCEYLRQTINERRFDKHEFSFKALNREGRRAILRIRDKQYAASLVDLPCIIEGMKSFDRRGWYKSADISQMLLVLGPVSSDQEAMEYPLPPEIAKPDEKTLQYPHGLAPPLRWVRKRRFRDRVSSRTIEQVEKAVEDLIAEDEKSLQPPHFELIDSASLNRAEGFAQGEGGYESYYDEEYDGSDAEQSLMNDMDDEIAAEMEAALAGGSSSAQPNTPGGAPAAESSGDESDDSGDERDDDLDDEQLERQQQLQQQREEVSELEELIRTETKTWENMTNAILRNKMGRRIQELKKDLELKKVSTGMSDETDI